MERLDRFAARLRGLGLHEGRGALEELRKAAEMFVQSMLEHGDAIPSDDVGSTGWDREW